MRTATISINPAALTHNLDQVKQLAPDAKILAMVKANAYGHGIQAVLPALQQADGLGVATFEEALEVRQLGWDKTIGLIEGVFCAAEWQLAIDNNCSCVIHHQPQLDWALENIPSADSLTRQIWLKFNTGMNRLGFDDKALIDAAKRLHNAGYQLILTTHFASANDRDDPLNNVQIQRFSDMLNYFKNNISSEVKGSLCNSAGIINFSNSQYDWIRPGIMLYGSSPVTDKSADDLNLQPAMNFSAKIIALQTVNTGDAIGYGSRWTAEQNTRIALVSIGYGDGYPRVVDADAYVCVIDATSNQSYPCLIRGQVAMDMIVIDLSTVPTDIAIDSTVRLWGDAPHVDQVAAHAGTISYELLCRLSSRPERTSV